MSNPPQKIGVEAIDAVPPIEVDSNPVQVDSSYEASLSESTFSTTLTSSILNYPHENGRRYHAFNKGSYPLPNDDREQERLDLLHYIFKLMLDGELFIAPLTQDPQRILDFGTGTGIWAIDFADQFPSADVIGTDLSPIQPGLVQSNCRFYVDDVESDWVYQQNEAFDFIHGRGMAGSIKDWPRLYRQAYKHLKPGGYLEMQEYEMWIRSDDGTLKNAKFINEWQEKVDEASKAFGKQMNVAALQKEYIHGAGFQDVTEVIHKLPQGPWPKNKKQKLIGQYQLAQMLDAVEPFSLAVLTRALGWSNEKVHALMAGVRADFQNPENHLYVIVRLVYGRKPIE